MKGLAVCITMCLAFAIGSPSALADRYYFDSWTTDNGLPQNSISSILQTRDGYLWLATADGLVRYDGVQFKVFNRGNTPGIIENRCYRLLEDRDGALWIRTGLGLMSYRGGVFQTYTTGDGLPDGSIYQIFEHPQGGLVIVSSKGAFIWRNGRSFPLVPAEDHPSGFAYQDKSGGLWINQDHGLVQISGDGKSIMHPSPPEAAGRDWAICAYEDSAGNFWFGTETGLYRYSAQTFVRYGVKGDLTESQVACIYEDNTANLWVSTVPGRVYRFHISPSETGRSNQPVPVEFNPQGAPADNRVDVFYQDREGTIWLGTSSYGLLRLNKQVVTVYSKESGLPADDVYPVFEDRQGAVWIGTWMAPVSRYKDGKFTYYGEPTLCTALAEDREGGLWIGKNTGLAYLKDGKLTQRQDIIGFAPPYDVSAIHEDRHGTLWFGTNAGMIRYADNVRTLYTTSDGLAGNAVRAILEDRQGTLWIGTYGGLSALRNGQWSSYHKGDGLASDQVRALYEDSDGTLWIGTYDGGLSRLKDGHITTYTTKDGLFNNGVFQILEDDQGNLWMSSNLGIYRTSRRQLNDFADGKIQAISCVSYGKKDGMASIECNGGTQPAGIRARDGRLWFPTQKGVAVIDPGKAPFNGTPPPVLIEDALVDRQPMGAIGALALSPKQESLEIRYTGISFIKPEQVRFRYRMEGLDKDWIEAGDRREAFYSHMPPGHYRFTVVAANADGVWNLLGASLAVTVAPPFWRTWWFSILAVTGLVAIALALYQRRVTMLKKAAAAQEVFSRRLIESQEIERKRIAAELHDGLQQSLSIIANRAGLALDKRSDPDRAFDQVSEIAATASDALKEVREIAYNLRPVELDRLGLTKALRAMAKKVAGSSRIDISASIDEINHLFASESEINLYRIVQESVNNIVKHSGATEASVVIKQVESGLLIAIHDNGNGFDAGSVLASDSRTAGFGLMGIQERARMLGGKYVIQSAPGLGTTINIQIDLRDQAHGR
jgi:signal transduction histidine kinase/ligand-binding sensor domain-containing protein